MPIDWDVYGKIVASEYRQQVILSIYDHPKTPTQIADEINKHQSHVSKTLRELVDLSLVECLNADATKGRLYTLSDEGEQVYSQLREEGYFEQ